LLAVSDNGCGIDKDIIEKIFDPFFTTKEVGKGTGQGLAISHCVIVDKHKGKIKFHTRSGKGTTFTISLPKAN
ncbi:MAG: PAS domain-containing sensor histidine kinase, partial [Desulfobacula sp.]|nr:PAS domain-containing sensor histidine kinase [Desulfobacula sp.]